MGAHDGQLQALGQLGGAARMVDVRMGDPDLLQRETQGLHSGQQHLQITPRVDHCGLHALIAPNDGAVLLERGDGDGFVMKHEESGFYRWAVKYRTSVKL